MSDTPTENDHLDIAPEVDEQEQEQAVGADVGRSTPLDAETPRADAQAQRTSRTGEPKPQEDRGLEVPEADGTDQRRT